jgi:hypothetical protein
MNGPVVVGALGGSGTRLVAAILMELGWFLGDDLNPEKDNLWFTLLFKRPRWYARVIDRRPDEIRAGFRVLERAMVSGGRQDGAGRAFLRRAVTEALLGRHGHRRAGTKGWPLKQAFGMLGSSRRAPRHGERWGWKEPNSHLYIRPLAEHFAELKFIYVVRHGLDMAFSGNRQQLYNWGPMFGVRAGMAGASVPRAMLDYWIKASERAIAHGRQALGERFLVLNYDALCTRPAENLPALLAFLGLGTAGADLDRLGRLAERPSTMGRYRDRDLREFDEKALSAVRTLGFPVE